MEKLGVVRSFIRETIRHGWQVAAGPRGEGWQLVQDGRKLYMNTNQHWLCLSLPVLESGQIDGDLCGSLLHLCQRSFLTKFSLSGARQVLLQAELPLAYLTSSDCQKALDGLAIYGDRYEQDLALAASAGDNGMFFSPNAVWRHTASGNGETSEIFSLEALASYFSTIEHLGWGIRDRPATNHWKTVYKGHERAFEVYLSFDRSWAYFQAPLLLATDALPPPSPACQALFYPYLLRLNEKLYWAKMGLDEDGQVLLMLEIPLEMFDLYRFRWAMRTIATYADEYAYDAQIMATLDQDKQLVILLSGRDA